MKFSVAVLVAVAGLSLSSAAIADGAQDMGAGAMNRGGPYDFKGGQAIYTNVCQGCHMPDAKGAVGAGMYPALAKNEKLETAGVFYLKIELAGTSAQRTNLIAGGNATGNTQ